METINLYKPSLKSQLSHDLRMPITGIMGMAQFLNDTALTPEQKNYVAIIEASAQRLLKIEPKWQALLAIE